MIDSTSRLRGEVHQMLRADDTASAKKRCDDELLIASAEAKPRILAFRAEVHELAGDIDLAYADWFRAIETSSGIAQVGMLYGLMIMQFKYREYREAIHTGRRTIEAELAVGTARFLNSTRLHVAASHVQLSEWTQAEIVSLEVSPETSDWILGSLKNRSAMLEAARARKHFDD